MIMQEEQVILVNENDEQIGLMEKMKAHIEVHLHRAFSVFVFNSRGELLLQQRALSKYHTPGLWTNTCCSHPAMAKLCNKLPVEGSGKKWVCNVSLAKRSILFTKPM